MTARRFADWYFLHVGRIEVEREENGTVRELMPQSRYKGAATTPLNAYGAGPFCRFRIGRGRREPGLYVLTIDDHSMYAGECVNLGQRWGPNGYGGISPRNCFEGGQPTNCRINAAILVAAKEGKNIDLWFVPHNGDTDVRRAAETILIQALQPPWNRAKLARPAL